GIESAAYLPKRRELLDGSRQLAGPRSQFTQQPRILHRDDSLIGEGLHQFDLLVGERLDFELVEDDYAHDVIAPKHGNAELRADGIGVSQCIAVFRIRLQIRNMNRPSLERDSPRDAVAVGRDGMALDELDQLRGDVVARREVIRVPLPSHDHPTSGCAQPRRVLDKGIEYWLEIE